MTRAERVFFVVVGILAALVVLGWMMLHPWFWEAVFVAVVALSAILVLFWITQAAGQIVDAVWPPCPAGDDEVRDRGDE